MPTEIRTKQKTFGGADVAHFRSPPAQELPQVISIIVSFEEALKLHLSLGQALARLNSYHRATIKGKRSAVNLRLYTEKRRIVVDQSQLPARKNAPSE